MKPNSFLPKVMTVLLIAVLLFACNTNPSGNQGRMKKVITGHHFHIWCICLVSPYSEMGGGIPED